MRNEREIGIYDKYTVTRNDGTGASGKKHDGCSYYVLDLVHDPYARPAILAYADACEKTHPVLAADLRHIAETGLFSGGRT